jgi:hypothetical protein
VALLAFTKNPTNLVSGVTFIPMGLGRVKRTLTPKGTRVMVRRDTSPTRKKTQTINAEVLSIVPPFQPALGFANEG